MKRFLFFPKLMEVSVLCVVTFTLAHGEPQKFSDDPQTKFAPSGLEWEKKYNFKRAAVIRFPFQGNSVYSEQAETAAREILKKSGRWDVLSADKSEPALERDLDPSQEKPYETSQLQAWASEWAVDSIWIVTASKRGESIQLSFELYHRDSEAKILQWTEYTQAGNDLKSTEAATHSSFKTLFQRIPFDGQILARNEKKVTLSLGSQNGVKKNQILIVTRIEAIKFTPESQLIENMYLKEVGRIRVIEADEDLSFGIVESEKSEEPILANHKVVIPLVPLQDPTVAENQAEKNKTSTPSDLDPMEKVAYGENAETWNPRRPPSLGLLNLDLGLGTTRINDSLGQGQRANFTPSMRFEAELWFHKNFFLMMHVQETMIGLSDSSAGLGLNSNSTLFSIAPGCRYLINNSVEGAQIRLMMGYSGYFFFVDSTTNASGLTSRTYDGFTVFIDAYIPVYKKWNASLGFSRTFWTDLSEGVSSGGSNSNIAWSFFIRTFYKMSQRWGIDGAIRFESFSSTYKNATRTSASIRNINFQSGLLYYF